MTDEVVKEFIRLQNEKNVTPFQLYWKEEWFDELKHQLYVFSKKHRNDDYQWLSENAKDILLRFAASTKYAGGYSFVCLQAGEASMLLYILFFDNLLQKIKMGEFDEEILDV